MGGTSSQGGDNRCPAGECLPATLLCLVGVACNSWRRSSLCIVQQGAADGHKSQWYYLEAHFTAQA